MKIPDDPRIDTYGQDAGYCGNCLKHLDDGCECTEEEREEGYTMQDRAENFWHDRGEEMYQRELEERDNEKQ